jgi:hypothetical protein
MKIGDRVLVGEHMHPGTEVADADNVIEIGCPAMGESGIVVHFLPLDIVLLALDSYPHAVAAFYKSVLLEQ